MQKVVVVAPKGKMGRLIIQTISERDDMMLIGSIAPEGRDYIGEDSGFISRLGVKLNAPVFSNLDEIIPHCDVIIDFSMTDVSLNILNKAIEYKKSLVCGTTGFSNFEMSLFEDASKFIPILYAANTSKAVNCMHKLLETASKILGNESDIEIIEMHDNKKLDAPSGTSKEMGHIIAENLDIDFDTAAKYGRSGKGIRNKNEIGYHSIRSGDISSSHTVIFGMMGERLEITHHAYNWLCFARGACDCAKFLQDKQNGLYKVSDVITI
ncbi:MAG: 4-hydroxy-tetrahydrodipicolinate reductase [Proteocatella sp.]